MGLIPVGQRRKFVEPPPKQKPLKRFKVEIEQQPSYMSRWRNHQRDASGSEAI